MAIDIDITIDDKASKSINALNELLKPSNRSNVMLVAGQAALGGVQEYYNEFNTKGGWLNKSLPTHGPGRKSSGFGNLITEGWNVSKASATGFTLNNGAPFFSSKLKDWTQTPKKSNGWITIPLVPEAHGVRARDFPRETFFWGRTIAVKEPSGENKAIYALVKSVDHKKVKGALAPEEVYMKPALNSIEEQLERALGI
jgi:hypothetical protein